jgi:hypothetical protein
VILTDLRILATDAIRAIAHGVKLGWEIARPGSSGNWWPDELATCPRQQIDGCACGLMGARGDTVIVGPGCFAMTDGSVLSWRGVHYVPQK